MKNLFDWVLNVMMVFYGENTVTSLLLHFYKSEMTSTNQQCSYTDSSSSAKEIDEYFQIFFFFCLTLNRSSA